MQYVRLLRDLYGALWQPVVLACERIARQRHARASRSFEERRKIAVKAGTIVLCQVSQSIAPRRVFDFSMQLAERGARLPSDLAIDFVRTDTFVTLLYRRTVEPCTQATSCTGGIVHDERETELKMATALRKTTKAP